MTPQTEPDKESYINFKTIFITCMAKN